MRLRHCVERAPLQEKNMFIQELGFRRCAAWIRCHDAFSVSLHGQRFPAETLRQRAVATQVVSVCKAGSPGVDQFVGDSAWCQPRHICLKFIGVAWYHRISYLKLEPTFSWWDHFVGMFMGVNRPKAWSFWDHARVSLSDHGVVYLMFFLPIIEN